MAAIPIGKTQLKPFVFFTEISTCHDLEELDLIIENLKYRSMTHFAEKMSENLD